MRKINNTGQKKLKTMYVYYWHIVLHWKTKTNYHSSLYQPELFNLTLVPTQQHFLQSIIFIILNVKLSVEIKYI